MSKKLEVIKKAKQVNKRKRIFRIAIKTITYIFYVAIFLVVVAIIYGQIISRPSKQIVCIKSKDDAEKSIKALPEVSKYIKKLNSDQKKLLLDINMPLITGNETKTGYAYVGELTSDNSKIIFSKYIFVTGCSSKIQKQKVETDPEKTRYRPVYFDYINRMASNTFVDETKSCLRDLTKVYKIDFDRDGVQEMLYGCFVGGDSNSVEYFIYKNNDGKITLLDQVSSSGQFEEIGDFNKDGYPDIATSEILMDVGACTGEQCYASSGEPNGGKYLLKQSYHHLWDPKTSKFGNAEKAEVYYVKDGKKIVVDQPK